MPAFKILALPHETRQALLQRAEQNGTSTDAEIRKILDEALRLDAAPLIGSEIAAFGRRFGGLELEVRRDPQGAEQAIFG